MPATIQIDATQSVEHLRTLDEKTRQKLADKLRPLADKVASDARANAAAHIHLLGSKPGQYLASIYGEVKADETGVIGMVRSANPLAHIMEYGASRAAHEILPDVAQALHFVFGGAEIFAGAVFAPASLSPAFHDIGRAFDANLADIQQAIIEATRVNDASDVGASPAFGLSYGGRYG